MNPGSSGVKQQQQTAASIGGGSSLSLSSSCSSSSAEEEILVVEETAAGQSLPPPLFFIKPIDSQGQSIAGKERLEDRGTLLPVACCLLPTQYFLLSPFPCQRVSSGRRRSRRLPAQPICTLLYAVKRIAKITSFSPSFSL